MANWLIPIRAEIVKGVMIFIIIMFNIRTTITFNIRTKISFIYIIGVIIIGFVLNLINLFLFAKIDENRAGRLFQSSKAFGRGKLFFGDKRVEHHDNRYNGVVNGVLDGVGFVSGDGSHNLYSPFFFLNIVYQILYKKSS